MTAALVRSTARPRAETEGANGGMAERPRCCHCIGTRMVFRARCPGGGKGQEWGPGGWVPAVRFPPESSLGMMWGRGFSPSWLCLGSLDMTMYIFWQRRQACKMFELLELLKS